MLCPKCCSDSFVSVETLEKVHLGWVSEINCENCEYRFIYRGLEYRRSLKKELNQSEVKEVVSIEKFEKDNKKANSSEDQQTSDKQEQLKFNFALF